MPKREKRQKRNRVRLDAIESLAVSFSTWVGSVSSLIVHTILFAFAFVFVLFGVSFDKILLILTTLLSFEAIYLAIFIQMSVNRTTQAIEVVEQDIEELSEDVEEIGEGVVEISGDVDEIQKDMQEISQDVDEIQKDVEEISHDVDEIQKDVDEISEDVDELTVDSEKK